MTSTFDLPYCDELPYWRTGKSSPDVWIDRTVATIKGLGATDISQAFGSMGGREAYMIGFHAGGEKFRVTWPVLKVRRPEYQTAARVQAATLLYHDCKAKAVAASVFGFRTAFFSALLLPDGRTAGEVATPALASVVPPLLTYNGE